MTFDKYDGKITGWGNVVFPNDGYLYDYICNEEIGWMQIREEKIEDLPEQKYSIRIPQEIKYEE